MCEEIDGDHMLIEDVVSMLEGLKADLEMAGAELVDQAIREVSGEDQGMELLRAPISEEQEEAIVEKVQAKIDSLTSHPSQDQPTDDSAADTE